LGHVGLPLGLVWAEAGLTVGVYDLDAAKVREISDCRMPFLEHGAEPILERVYGKKFFLVKNIDEIANATAVLVAIGTPVDEFLSPQLMVMGRLADQLAPHLHAGQHFILRSTVFPGTTDWLRDYFAARGLALHVSYCPERMAQGHAVQELRELPHIVASCSKEGSAYCAKIFRLLNDNIVEVGVKEAEPAKLYSNAWRYITFAVANQFYMMTEKAGASVREVHRAMTEGYERGGNIPRPGFAAGPCLLKDTLQLSAFNSNNFNLGHAAMLVNEGLPAFCIEQLRQNHNLKGMKVGLLGMAFKAEIDDGRGSLAFRLRKLLTFHGAEVLCTDEYLQADDFFSLEDVLKDAALFIVGVPHGRYRTLEFPAGKPVFNLWNMDSAGKT
jgi:UDP-N-acetyl-D-mannosaminuronic acid dehydrogenase